ncbi:MerR family transcriptional regulator [Streptomyces sp. WMMB 322]|uniref:transcriptional regulator FtsR n=1 Tax=Streptomyces sp. WMMB 322 TaxID=1286821 RepID=UPI0006E18186|nr:MerR family transcriptional regulator [Streptomyces sp. WMMB 322]SCK58557.1 MerR family regulatory protein [Streptomyces sp. WMMB 322]
MEHTLPGGTGDGAAARADGPLGIGGVLRALRGEFPGVTVSKIRFLETEGLVKPGRSPSGHRRFGSEDVERLRDVLRMQRDLYLPLKVIKERLRPVATGQHSSPSVQQSRRSTPRAPAAAVSAPGTGVSRRQLLAITGAMEADLAEWEAQGLLSPHPDGSYDAGAVSVARIVSDLDGHGIPPRRLREVKAAAEHQAEMLASAGAPPEFRHGLRSGGGPGSSPARLAALSVRLYEVFVQTAMDVGPAEGPGPGSCPGE